MELIHFVCIIILNSIEKCKLNLEEWQLNNVYSKMLLVTMFQIANMIFVCLEFGFDYRLCFVSFCFLYPCLDFSSKVKFEKYFIRTDFSF